jgi:hypothetical protein
MTSTEIIKRLPFEMERRLTASEYFCDISAVVADEGNVTLEMKRKQVALTSKGGKTGVGVVILQLMLDDGFPNLQFGPMTLRPAIQVVELLELNRGKNGTGKAAREIARRIRDEFKGTIIFGLTKSFETEKDFMEPVPLDLGPNAKGYEVRFKCLEGPADTVTQVALPGFAIVPGNPQTLAISCATAGAAIWFTTDDSYPVPTTIDANSTATQYGGPLPIPDAGFLVRAVAFAPGMIQSSPLRANIVPAS